MSDAEKLDQAQEAEPEPREGGEQLPSKGDAAGGSPSEGNTGGHRSDAGGHASDAGGHPSDGDAAAIEGELDELVKTSAQRDEYLALAQRTQADFENYRKRISRDLAAAQERGVAKLAKELLPALDNLDRALEAAESDDPLLAGIRLVRNELSAALTRVGIEQFAPLGERFDPNEHEAMAQQPVEGVESGSVAEVFQDGYRLNGTIIRPARVLVAA